MPTITNGLNHLILRPLVHLCNSLLRGGGQEADLCLFKRIASVFLAFLSIALWATPVAAAFSIEYQAPADPTTVGFSPLVGVGPAPQVTVPIPDDQGYPAWSISGLELSSQFRYYSGALDAAQKAEINSQGFTLTLRGRVLQDKAPAYDAGYYTVIGGAFLSTESKRYDLFLGINSSGNTVAVLSTYLDVFGPGRSLRTSGPSYTLNDAGYHTYDLVFNPNTQSASLFIDGVERISGYNGQSLNVGDEGLMFGAFSGGGINVNLARLTSGILPIANAGPDRTASAGTPVTLDGSASSDPSGHLPLTYEWSFVSKPAGSNATLSNSSTVNPTFTPDVVGDYVIRLVVTNAINLTSQPDTVTVSSVNSPPVADAGKDQAITVIGTTVHLNGLQSYDPDGQSITFLWSILSQPAGSNATLTNATTATPSFVANVQGSYSIQLIVTDSLGAKSEPDSVVVSFNNLPPVADAGPSQSATVGQEVKLDGSKSTDANGDPLTYKWAINSAPSGSQAVINNPTAQITSFVPDLPGTFVVQLIVNDGFVDSLPATAQVEAMKAPTTVTQDIHNLQQVIAQMAPSAFKNDNLQNALLNKLNAVIASIETGNYSDALGQLQNDILGKTDGCATSRAPDKNDWILTCANQNSVYPSLVNIIKEVQALAP